MDGYKNAFQMTKSLASLNGYDHQNQNGQFWGGKKLKKDKTYCKGMVFLSFIERIIWKGLY